MIDLDLIRRMAAWMKWLLAKAVLYLLLINMTTIEYEYFLTNTDNYNTIVRSQYLYPYYIQFE